MSTLRALLALSDVIRAAQERGHACPSELAVAVDSAQLLMPPETAAELVALRARVAELEANRPGLDAQPASVAEARCVGCGEHLDDESISDFCSDRCESVVKLRKLLGHQRQAEDAYRSPLHHAYRVPRDLEEAIDSLGAPGGEAALQAKISGPPTCAECLDPVEKCTTYCSTRCRNAADPHDSHDEHDDEEGDSDA